MTQNFPVPQEAVEAGLLNSVNQSMDSWLAIQTNFTTDDFATHRDIFIFMQQYLGQYNVLPTTSLLSTRFQWSPPIGDFAYWMTEMKRYASARRVLEVLNEGFQQIQDPEQALDTVLQKLSLIRSRASNHVQATDTMANDRLQYFDNRTEQLYYGNRMVGIKTGIDIINDTLMGWEPTNLVGNYARIGVGKSWWLINECAVAWMEGWKVLFISGEMAPSLLNLRIDTVISDKLGYHVDYNKLRHGNPEVREIYETVTSTMAAHNRWWTYDSFEGRTIGLREIETLCAIHKPDIVAVDVMHALATRQSRGAMWERIHDLSYGLKDVATRAYVPILVTSHASNTERGRRINDEQIGRSDTFHMPSLNDAAYGDSFVQACSDIITMCPEPNSKHINWYSIRKTRERGFDNLPPRMAIAVDYSFGRMVDLGRLGYDPEAVTTEARRVLGLANVGA